MRMRGAADKAEGERVGELLTVRRMNELFAFMVWPIAQIMALQLLICHLSDY